MTAPETTYPRSASQTPMTGAQVILKALEEQGVEVIFGYPGGAVLPIYDAIFQQNRIKHVLVRHEQAAVHAAEGYARSTGKTGVVLVTSGPGATNTVTGLTDALMDSVPVVCLTGQVPTNMIGNDAFQEADTCGITRPCTKHNYLVKDTDRLAYALHEAFHVAASGRPGPVVVDLPKDIVIAECPYVGAGAVKPRVFTPKRTIQERQIAQAIELLAQAERPVIYAGGGVINAGVEACELLTRFTRATGFPITLTLMGLGAYPSTDPQCLQMLGMHGSLEANRAMHQCDVMLCVGARFDDRVTGALSGFSPNSKKIHIDVDASSINKNVAVDLGIVSDTTPALKALLDAWQGQGIGNRAEAIQPWWQRIAAWRGAESYGFKQPMDAGTPIKPQHAIHRLYEISRARGLDTFVTTEVGQHQMWAAQHFKFDEPFRWMTSGGLGTMGYGFPSAMGVQVAHPEALVVCVAGDASWLMNMQECSTLKQYRLPVKSFILNNSYMGMVRQWQEMFFGNRESESYMDSLPDFVKLAEAFGMKGLRATSVDQVDDVIAEMIDTPGPVIVDMVVERAENVFPMIPAGASHAEILLAAAEDDKARMAEDGMVLV